MTRPRPACAGPRRGTTGAAPLGPMGRAAALTPALLLALGCATRLPEVASCPELSAARPCTAGPPVPWPHPAGGTVLLCREAPEGVLRLAAADGECRLRLEGRLRHGRRDGVFRWRDAAGTVRREQAFEAGRASGLLRLFGASGLLELEAHLVEGVLEGPWTRFHARRAGDPGPPRPAETGSFRAGRRHGIFRRFDPEGLLLAEDTWREGRLEGPWRRFHPDGRVAAAGDRRAGETDGVVRRFDRRGRLVEETGYRAGVLHGVHRRLSSAGTAVLEETWRHGRLHGLRRVRDERGRLLREEAWRRGVLHGPTRLYAPEGHLREEIHYREGRRHGPYTLWHGPGRAARVGHYEDGRPVGVFTELDPSGLITAVREYGGDCGDGGIRIYEATPHARAGWCQRTGPDGTDRKHGPYALYAAPGREGEEPSPEPGPVPEGWWTRWRDRGPLLERAHYRDGRLDGPFERYAPGGRKIAEGHYAGGRRSGTWTFWHPNGALAERGRWKAGRRHGRFVHAGETGTVLAEGEYRDGRRVGRWRFRPADGGPVRTVLYTAAGERTR